MPRGAMAVEIPEAGAVTHIEVSLGAVAEFYGTCAARLEPAPPSETHKKFIESVVAVKASGSEAIPSTNSEPVTATKTRMHGDEFKGAFAYEDSPGGAHEGEEFLDIGNNSGAREHKAERVYSAPGQQKLRCAHILNDSTDKVFRAVRMIPEEMSVVVAIKSLEKGVSRV
ncbi:hypothetical protein C8Q76DRAFT_689103 [Earliella scabrosa]|nr:hypothetical protein C8Q76DRAFT_689103 [Earliella scabrosa]